METNGKTFEEIVKRVEEIVARMETGGVSLEEMMKLYEEGSRKISMLTAMLTEARDKVLKLVTDSEGSSKLEVFDEE